MSFCFLQYVWVTWFLRKLYCVSFLFFLHSATQNLNHWIIWSFSSIQGSLLDTFLWFENCYSRKSNFKESSIYSMMHIDHKINRRALKFLKFFSHMLFKWSILMICRIYGLSFVRGLWYIWSWPEQNLSGHAPTFESLFYSQLPQHVSTEPSIST